MDYGEMRRLLISVCTKSVTNFSCTKMVQRAGLEPLPCPVRSGASWGRLWATAGQSVRLFGGGVLLLARPRRIGDSS
jgi:hypothetical protein